jgi:hypothetical protein
MLFPLPGKKQTTVFPAQETLNCHAHVSRRRDMHKLLLFASLASLIVVSYVTSISLIVVPFLGILCIFASIHTCNSALLIPGGLLSGVGLGGLLTAGPFQIVTGDLAVSLFLLTCALGWFSIALFSRLFMRHTQWWAIIPGGMMALTSLFVFA